MPKRNKKAKKKEIKTSSWGVNVIDDWYSEITREADPDDEWSCDDTTESHSIQGIEVVGEDKFGDLIVGFEPKKDQTYYLVYVRHASGCSFCTHYGLLECVNLYETEEKAYKAMNEIESKNGAYPIKIETESGGELLVGGWDDYFGGFDYADVESVKIIKKH